MNQRLSRTPNTELRMRENHGSEREAQMERVVINMVLVEFLI